MTSQAQTKEAKGKQKPRPKPLRVELPEGIGEVGPRTEMARGLSMAAGDPVEGQAARLADPRLAESQRQALAAGIGNLQGNDHLQGVVASANGEDRKETYPAVDRATRKNGNESTNHLANSATSGSASRSTSGGGRRASSEHAQGTGPRQEAAVADEIAAADFGAAGAPSMAPTAPSDDGNGRWQGPVIRRQEDEASEAPSEAEKAAALAAARAAEGRAGQAASKGRSEISKSKAEKSVEKEARKAAEAKAESAGSAGAAPLEAKQVRASKAAKGETRGKKGARGKAGGAPGPGGPAAGTAVAVPSLPGKAPASPQEDPAFQAVAIKVKGVAKKQKAHSPAAAKAGEAQGAAESPASEIEAKAQSNQVGEMEAAESPPFDAAAFKAQLMGRIQELAPRTAEEADNFKEQNKVGGLKDEMKGKVAEEKSASKSPMEQAAEKPPDTAGVEPKPHEPLTPTEPGAPPTDVGASKAAPKPKGASQVEKPLKENAAKIDQQMAEADITEEQLAKSNEPEFKRALDAKKEAKAQAEAGPQEYRQSEADRISRAEDEAAAMAQDRTQAMHGDRAAALSQVEEQQGQTKSEDEGARARIAADIQRIYARTKAQVERILNELDGKVEATFDSGAAAAKRAFEDYVDARMEAYKERRYGGWLGWARWAKDKIAGMPSEVNAFYSQGRDLYLRKMDAVIDKVVEIIGRGVTEAKAEIAKGKAETETYVAQLPEDLQAVGQQAASDIQDRFDDLENSVEDKQNELIDTLANKYQENLAAIDARIEELKAANKGLVDRAIDAVAGVIRTIMKLKDMLTSVLARVADVVGKILKDPISFLGNLISGVKQGLDRFLGNILTHLQSGLIGWLTGALGPIGITLPEDIFSLEGIFSLVLQVLGISWEYIRARAVKHLGEPVVKVLETGFEIFQVIRNEGAMGLWQWVKDEFADLKEMVLEQIKQMVITEVIKAGVKWILGILNPAGALVKAAMTIYNIVMFFIERGGQIIELVHAVIDGVAAVVSGNLGAMAAKIEDALAKALPVVIGFLANLLGLGGLAKRVKRIITRVRRRVGKAIDKLILKAKKAARGLLRRVGIGGAGGEPEAEAEEAPEGSLHGNLQNEFRGKLSGVSDRGEVAPVIQSAYHKYKEQGLKSLRVVEDSRHPGRFRILAEASPEEEVATFETALGIEVGDLLPLAGGPGWGKTTLSAYMLVGDRVVNLGKHENTREEDLHAVDRHAEKSLLRELEGEWASEARKGVENHIVIEITRSPCADCSLVLSRFVQERRAQGYDVRLTVRTLSLYGGTKGPEEETRYEGTRIAIDELDTSVIRMEAWDIFAELEERGIKIDEKALTADQQRKLRSRIDQVKRAVAGIEEAHAGA
jgi:hypothetical protein